MRFVTHAHDPEAAMRTLEAMHSDRRLPRPSAGQAPERCPDCASTRIAQHNLPAARGRRMLTKQCQDCEYLFDVELSDS